MRHLLNPRVCPHAKVPHTLPPAHAHTHFPPRPFRMPYLTPSLSRAQRDKGMEELRMGIREVVGVEKGAERQGTGGHWDREAGMDSGGNEEER